MDDMNNHKQINRYVTPIKLDENGNRIEEVKPVITPVAPLEKKTTSNIPLIIFLVIVALALLAFLGFIILPDYLKSTDPKNYYNDETTTKKVNYLNKEVKIYTDKYLVPGEFKVDNNYEIKVVNNGVNNSLFINNKEVLTASNILSRVALIHKLIAVSTFDNNLFVLSIYDNEGTLIKQIDSVNDKNLNIKDININKENILLISSRISNNNILSNGEEIDPCNNDILKDRKISSKTVVSENYALRYLGNNKFDKLKSTSKVTLEEYQRSICS